MYWLHKTHNVSFLTQQILASKKSTLSYTTRFIGAVRLRTTSLGDTNVILGKSYTVLKYGICVVGCNIQFTIFNVKGHLHTPYPEV
jgi:hypothetical protein